MKRISWNLEKAYALSLDADRNHVGFEDCVIAIESGNILDVIANPSPNFRHQRMLILNINNYAYVVPYVENDQEYFLKTVFPSRKHTAIYLKDKSND